MTAFRCFTASASLGNRKVDQRAVIALDRQYLEAPASDVRRMAGSVGGRLGYGYAFHSATLAPVLRHCGTYRDRSRPCVGDLVGWTDTWLATH